MTNWQNNGSFDSTGNGGNTPSGSDSQAQGNVDGSAASTSADDHAAWAQPQPQPAAAGPGRKGIGALGVAALMLGSAAVGGGAAAVVVNSSSNSTSVSQEAQNALSAPGETRSEPAQAGSTEAVAQQVLPSVVSIKVTTRDQTASGSGSILSSDGLVLTNNHVVADAAEGGASLEVQLNDGSRHAAKFIAGDAATDIAVIQIQDVSDLRPITLGSSDDVQVGQEVIAVGSPLGLSSTVTQGIVSAKNRPVTAAGENGEQSVIDAIQTDAAINPGNSGGALVDMEGHLIGVPSVIATMGSQNQQSGSIGLGFAIPIDQARRIAEDLIKLGKTQMPIIGASIDTRDTESGALIAEVSAGGPAEQAGLQPGDVITKIDSRPIDSGVALIAAVRSHRVGDTVTLTVTNTRGDGEREVTVTLAEAER